MTTDPTPEGCPETLWDPPFTGDRCGGGADSGVCGIHGEFAPPLSAPTVHEEALTAAHLAVEAALVDFRDRRISVDCANGFVIKERNGRLSDVTRFSTRDGLRIAIRAYLQATEGVDGD